MPHPSSLLALPDEVLKLILQHVPLRCRLSSCCLVSRKLHAAATAATELVSLGACDVCCRHPASALQWICQYGQHLTSLKLDAGVSHALTVTQLPCSNLSELVVSSGSIQLGPTPDGQPGVIPSLTALTRLELRSCKCADAPAGGVLDCFSSLARLQHLDVHLRGDGSPLVDSVFCLSDATLPRLQQLTYLSVSELSVDNLLHLGGLSELQQLHLSGCEVVLGPNSPGLALPVSLTCLKLYFPAVVDAGFLSLVPVGLQELLLDCHMEGAAATLLCDMTRLQSLTSLFLMNGGGLLWPPPGPAYSALAASSRLGRLGLRSINLEGAWPHILPAKCQLPFLTALHMPAGAVDLPTLVSCCPSLCCAGTLSLEHGAPVSELRKLSALTCLWCRYEPAGLGALTQSMQGLAAVKQLRDLAIYVGSPILVAGLLPLTSLTALTHFTCDCTSGSDSDADDDGQQEAVSFLTLTTTTQVGSAPDVWLQLLERCAAVPSSQPAVLRSLARQLEAQRAMTAQQLAEQQALTVQQLSAQQQLITGLQGQLQELRADLQVLRRTKR